MDEVKREISKQRKWRRRVNVWIIVFSTFVIQGQVQNRQDAHNNKNRIADIQQSRVAGCQGTYDSIRIVFEPFFPPPKLRTARQRRDLAKLNTIIAQQKAKCIERVTP